MKELSKDTGKSSGMEHYWQRSGGGRQPKIPKAENTYTSQFISKNKLISCKGIIDFIKKRRNIDVSRWTVSRKFNKIDYRKVERKGVPLMTNLHKAKRLKFAKKYKDFDWKSVIFSDESIIQTYANTVKVWAKSHHQLFSKNQIFLLRQ